MVLAVRRKQGRGGEFADLSWIGRIGGARKASSTIEVSISLSTSEACVEEAIVVKKPPYLPPKGSQQYHIREVSSIPH